MGKDPAEDSVNRSSLQDTLDEHHTCMRMVAEVESILDRKPDREGRWIKALQDKLPVLGETLQAHFEAEEAATLYCEVPIRKPRLAPRIEKLAAEHGEMLRSVQRVIKRARALDEPAEVYQMREINALVQLLIATIRRHEAEENEIIMGAYWDELGAAD